MAPSRSRHAGWQSWTSPAARSRSRARTVTSSSSATARSTTTARSGAGWRTAAMFPNRLGLRGPRAPVRGARPRLRRRLRGMFALALWDGRRASPAAGARPLRHQAAAVYALDHGRLAFASELRALPALPRRPARPRPRDALDLSGLQLRPGRTDHAPRGPPTSSRAPARRGPAWNAARALGPRPAGRGGAAARRVAGRAGRRGSRTAGRLGARAPQARRARRRPALGRRGLRRARGAGRAGVRVAAADVQRRLQRGVVRRACRLPA